MNDTDQKQEEEVLRRMLQTPPKPHKGKPAEPRIGLAKLGGKIIEAGIESNPSLSRRIQTTQNRG